MIKHFKLILIAIVFAIHFPSLFTAHENHNDVLKQNCDTDPKTNEIVCTHKQNNHETDELDPEVKESRKQFHRLKRKMEKKGYEYHKHFGFYKFHKKPASWFDARGICQKEGAHLVVLNSEKEVNLVVDIFNQHPPVHGIKEPSQMLIGIHDQNKEGHFETVTGESVKNSGYAKWGPGQPDNGSWENCGAIVVDTKMLNDFPCHYESTFMCELEWTPIPKKHLENHKNKNNKIK